MLHMPPVIVLLIFSSFPYYHVVKKIWLVFDGRTWLLGHFPLPSSHYTFPVVNFEQRVENVHESSKRHDLPYGNGICPDPR